MLCLRIVHPLSMQKVAAMTMPTASASAYEVKPLCPDRAARRGQLLASLLGSSAQPEDARGLAPGHLGAYHAFKPQNDWENWVAGQAALLMFRIERNQRIERRVRELAALRAIDCWEIDQAALAETTALKLATNPSKARAALWTSLAGCDWLLARWAELRTDDIGGWTSEQRTLAHQIYPFEPDRMTRPGAIADHIDQLRAQRARMVEVDQVERALVEADLADHLGPAVRAVRSAGRALERRLDWCLKELRTPPPGWAVRSAFYPDFVTPLLFRPAPEAEAEAEAEAATPAPTDIPTSESTGADLSETNPPVADASDLSETNPPVADASDLSETNPPVAGATGAVPQVDPESDLATVPRSRLTVSIDGHRRRVDPAAELARQREAERRRRA